MSVSVGQFGFWATASRMLVLGFCASCFSRWTGRLGFCAAPASISQEVEVEISFCSFCVG